MFAGEGHLGVDISNSDVCSGVHVKTVHPKDLFALAGIKPGWVITSVNGSTVCEHVDAMDIMKAAKTKEIKLEIVFLTEDEAKKQGAVEAAESAACTKWIVGGLLIFLAVIALMIALAYTGQL